MITGGLVPFINRLPMGTARVCGDFTLCMNALYVDTCVWLLMT